MAKHICTKEPVFTKLFVAQEATHQEIKHIRKTLEGNGNPGLMTKMEEAHDYILQTREKEKNESKIESWSRRKLIFWGTSIFVVLQFLLWVGYEFIKVHI